MASREELLQEAYDFYDKNGHLFVHKSTNADLNEFLDELRIEYTNSELSKPIIDKFNSMGMVWRNVEQAEWEYCYDLAREYNTMYKTLNMPKTYEYKDIKLGEWINSQVKKYHRNELSLLRYEKLNDLNINWEDRSTSKISFYEQAVAYYVTKAFPDTLSSYRPDYLHGKELDIYIPSLKVAIEYDGGQYHQDIKKDLEKNRLCAENGIKLIRIRGVGCPKMDDKDCIIIKQRQKHGSTKIGLEFAIKKLFNELVMIKYGMRTEDLFFKKIPMPDIDIFRDEPYIVKDKDKGIEVKMSFDKNVEALIGFYKENGHCVIPNDYKTTEGIKLGEWLDNLRNFYKDDKSILTKEQLSYLNKNSPGWEAVQKSKWLYNMSKITFKDGYIYIPKGATTFDDKDLYKWFNQELNFYYSHNMPEAYKTNFLKNNGIPFGIKKELPKVQAKIMRTEYKKKNKDLER